MNPLPTFTKKQKQKVDAWALNIKAKLDKAPVEGESIVNYIDGLAKTDLTILQGSLNSTYAFGTPHEELTLLDLAITRGLMNQHTSISKQSVEAIAPLLKYATHPNKHVNNALVLFYDTFASLSDTDKSFDGNLAKPILYSFLAYPDTWDVKSTEGDTLAHAAVRLGDWALVEKALAHNPQWLEATNNHYKETLLYTATRYGRDDIVEKLINDYNANINAVNISDLNVLANTIHFHSSRTIKLLLSKGCSINPFTNIVIPNKARKSILVLMAAGYFIPSAHREPINSKKVSEYLGIPLEKFNQPLFYLISKDDVTNIDLISSAEDLKASTLVPSPVQVERLMLSLQETLLYDKDEGLRALYEAFKEKHGVDIHVEPMQVHTISAHTVKEFSFSKILKEGMRNSASAEYIDMLKQILNEITQPQSIGMLTLRELRETLIEFSETLVEANAHNASNPGHRDFEKLIHLTTYKYFRHMLSKIVDTNQRDFLSATENCIINVIFVAVNHVLSDVIKHESKAITTIAPIIQAFKDKNLNSDTINFLEMTSDIININSYATKEFYSELLDAVNTIKVHRDNLKKKENRIASDHNIMEAFIFCMNSLAPSAFHFITQVKIISSIKHFLQMQSNKDSLNWEKLNTVLVQRTIEIQDLYAIVIKLLDNPVFEHGISEDKQSIILTFTGDVDKLKIKSVMDELMVDHPEIKRLNNNYRLYHYGMSLDALTLALRALNDITAQSIVPDPENIVPDNIQREPLNQTKNYYCLPAPSHTTRTVITSRRIMSSFNDENTSSTVQAEVAKPSLDAIKEEILTKLGLGKEAEIYHMIHPRYPASRQHLCWGVWIPGSMVNRPAAVTDEMLERHHDLLKDKARLEIPATGANGFKAVQFINLDTGKTEYTYKTKRAKENERILAVPYQVELSTHENASVYCFGVIDPDHSDDMLKISPTTFLQQYKVKDKVKAAPMRL